MEVSVKTPDQIALLQSEITELQAHINAATGRLHELIEEFNRLGGWFGWGVRSMEHWLSWQLGYSGGNAAATVRTAHALSELPSTREAFCKGEISQDQARAIAGAASPETDEYLLGIARHGTGAHLQRLCKLYRQVLASSGIEEARHVMERYLRFRYDDDGSLRLSGRFPADEGEVIRQAMSAVMEQLREDRTAPEPAAPAPEPEPDPEPVLSDVPVHPELEALLRRLEDEDDEEPYEPPVVPPAPPIAVQAPRYDDLCADALLALAESSLAHRLAERPGSERFKVIVHVDKLGAELERGVPMPSGILERIACDAKITAVRSDAENGDTKGISKRLRDEVNARDRRCRFPECSAVLYNDLHHILPRALGGPDTPENLIRLCWHHHRRVHDMGYRIERLDDGFVFRHPMGWLLEPAERGLDPGSPSLEDRQAGLGIKPDTATSRWSGERPDYGMAIDALFQLRGRL